MLIGAAVTIGLALTGVLQQVRVPRAPVARELAIARNKAIADAHAAKVLPVIRDIQRSGYVSLHQIAKQLNARHISTPRGGRW